MAYSFEQLLAADPSNPANIAQNASIVIFEPGDATQTPLTITDTTGSPLPNPIQVNANGFGPAFMHETLDRVAWAGGGFTAFMTSYEGMKAEAVAARAAAQDAQTEAAAAGANAAAEAATALAGAVADAEAAQAAAESAAALVGAPADAAIATAINGSATATKAALSATILDATAGKMDTASALTTFPLRETVQTVFRDDFTGSSLGSAWSVVRPDSTGARITGGALQIDMLAGDLEGAATNTAKNLHLVPLPDGPWVAETRVTADMVASGERFGLIAYRDDANYAAVMHLRNGSTNSYRRFTYERYESPRNVTDVDFTQQGYSTLVKTPRFRLVSDGKLITAYDSADDGATWKVIGRPAPAEPFTFVGLAAYGGAANTKASFDWFTLTYGVPVPVVPPIKEKEPFSIFNNPGTTNPTDSVSTAVRGILRNSDKYTLNTWFPATYGSQGSATYLNLGGINEEQVRTPSSAAFALATSLATLAYDVTAAGGVSISSARATCIRLIRSVAKAHKANTPLTGWGDAAQSALWAATAAQAGWLLWEFMTVTEQELVRRMVVAEANRRTRMDVEFWKDATGGELPTRIGDTAAEENAWNAMVLEIAVAMMPTHPRYKVWMKRLVELVATAYSIPADLTNTAYLNGQPVQDYMKGSNVNPDGTIINHSIIHPDYMAGAVTNLNAAVIFPLAGKPVPKAALQNIKLVYSALSTVNFATPTYAAPGGTIYKAGSEDVYYPQGNDWEPDGLSYRIMDKAAFDVMVSAFGIDAGLATPASTWAGLHLNKITTMQARSTTGQTYVAANEDIFFGREQWVGHHAAWAWLAKWVTSNSMYRVSNLPPSEL